MTGRPKSSSEEVSPAKELEEEELMVGERREGSRNYGSRALIPCHNKSE
jgi:hypothetical protein